MIDKILLVVFGLFVFVFIFWLVDFIKLAVEKSRRGHTLHRRLLSNVIDFDKRKRDRDGKL